MSKNRQNPKMPKTAIWNFFSTKNFAIIDFIKIVFFSKKTRFLPASHGFWGKKGLFRRENYKFFFLKKKKKSGTLLAHQKSTKIEISKNPDSGKVLWYYINASSGRFIDFLRANARLRTMIKR